jgi:hypothetical protein
VLGGLVAHLLARDAAAVSQKTQQHAALPWRESRADVRHSGRSPYLPDEEDHLIVVLLAAR